MARACRVSLFHREIRTTLSSAAIEILFGQATVISEGQYEHSCFFGSTMITIDCSQAGEWVSDLCDATTTRQVAELLLRDDRFRERARTLGEREAMRLARSPLGPIQLEMHIRTAGNHLHVDIDVESTPLQARAS